MGGRCETRDRCREPQWGLFISPRPASKAAGADPLSTGRRTALVEFHIWEEILFVVLLEEESVYASCPSCMV